MSQLIAAHVIAQRLKLATFATPGRFSVRGDQRARTQRLQFRFASPPHVWINFDSGSFTDARFTPHQVPTRKKADRDLSKFESSSFWRLQPVNQRGRSLSLHVQISLAQTRQFHLRRILVLDHQRNCARSGVLNVNVYVRLGADGESSTEFARDAHAFWKLTKTGVDYRERQSQEVVNEHDPTQPRPSPGKRKQDQAGGDQEVEEFGEDKAHKETEVRSQRSEVRSQRSESEISKLENAVH